MSFEHEIEEGECVASLAYEHGFYHQTVWKEPGNEVLRGQRESLYVLEPGDVVVIPDKRPGVQKAVSGRRHTFRRKGVPEKLKLQLLVEGEPRAQTSYELTVDGVVNQGETDAEGRIEHWISPAAQQGRLAIGDEVFELSLGRLSPISIERGVRARLVSLGFLAGGDETAEALAAALSRFQAQQRLPQTGRVDEITRGKLVEVYGS